MRLSFTRVALLQFIDLIITARRARVKARFVVLFSRPLAWRFLTGRWFKHTWGDYCFISQFARLFFFVSVLLLSINTTTGRLRNADWKSDSYGDVNIDYTRSYARTAKRSRVCVPLCKCIYIYTLYTSVSPLARKYTRACQINRRIQFRRWLSQFLKIPPAPCV